VTPSAPPDEVAAICAALGLRPHPEGGFFAETYRAPRSLDAPQGPRATSTAIYYLLPAGALSALHRLRSDEVWHFYAGQPIELHRIDEQGHHDVTRLGSDVLAGERPQLVVPAGVWQAARGPSHGFALCGCTVAPGFDYSDWELTPASELVARFPSLATEIARLSR
jgi:predicted cupin superfamily sugar epimerase